MIICCKAELEKEKGNEAYRKQDLSAAIKHYEKAIEFDPLNITYYTNKAGKFRRQFLRIKRCIYFNLTVLTVCDILAVLLEQNKCDECIKVCLEGIDVGRKNFADSSSLAKY